MKRHFLWILAGLILIRMFGFSSISFAQKEKWTKKADMPSRRRFLSISVVNGKIYAIGGDAPGALSTVEEYDPITDKWTKKSNMPTARSLISTGAVDRKIYAIGGSIGGIDPVANVEEYDPGLAGLGIEVKGKLVTSWGKIKSNHENLKEHEKARK